MGTKGKVPGHSFLRLDGKGGGPEGHRNRYRLIKGLSNNPGPRRKPYYFGLQSAILPCGAIATKEPYCLGPQGRQPNPMGSARQIFLKCKMQRQKCKVTEERSKTFAFWVVMLISALYFSNSCIPEAWSNPFVH